MYFKIWWIIRALIYKPFFGQLSFPSYIGKPVFLRGTKNIYLKNRVRIYPNIRMETHTVAGKIFVQEDTSIGQNVHITSAGNLIIGKGCTILANVFITNIDHNYHKLGTHILKQDITVSDTEIGDNTFIGIGACIQAGTILGRQCIIGANAVVRGVFPDYCVIVGVPARIVKRYNPESSKWEKTTPDGLFLP